MNEKDIAWKTAEKIHDRLWEKYGEDSTELITAIAMVSHCCLSRPADSQEILKDVIFALEGIRVGMHHRTGSRRMEVYEQ